VLVLAPDRARRLAGFVAIATISLTLDQLSKQWAYANLRGGEALPVFEGVLEFDFAFNPGSAFGLFAHTSGARPLFIIVTVFALAYMIWLVRRMPSDARWGFVALGLMTGGALGNLIDRLLRIHEVRIRFHDRLPFDALIEHPTRIADALARGRSYADVPRHGVIDFIVVHLGGERPWPAFNLADASLVIGVGLLVLTLLRHGNALTGGDGNSA
jgi:lipoprotein signal peptidase